MEQQILQFLQQTPGVFYSIKEIGKRLDRDEYRKNVNYLRPYVESLLVHKHIVADECGHVCYPKRKKLGVIE